MNGQTLLEKQWPYLVSLLPEEIDLDTSARETGALVRKRGVDSAESLLRIILAYALCEMPLRQTAAWAELQNVGEMSNAALCKRLKKCDAWMEHLLSVMLADRAPPPSLSQHAEGRWRTRLIDATSISQPGAKTTSWRIHLGYDLSRNRIDQIQISDSHEGESLQRFRFQPGDLVLADRGYSRRTDLHAVASAKASFVVRLNWGIVPFANDFDLFAWLRGLSDATASEVRVQVAADRHRKLPELPVRLVALRKSEAAAEKSRRKVLRSGTKHATQPDPRSLEAASYICLLTNELEGQISAREILGLYRFRWQVELAFKRMKSLLFLGDLPTKDPPTARTYLYAKLLGTLMLEDLTERFLDFSPWGYRLR